MLWEVTLKLRIDGERDAVVSPTLRQKFVSGFCEGFGTKIQYVWFSLRTSMCIRDFNFSEAVDQRRMQHRLDGFGGDVELKISTAAKAMTLSRTLWVCFRYFPSKRIAKTDFTQECSTIILGILQLMLSSRFGEDWWEDSHLIRGKKMTFQEWIWLAEKFLERIHDTLRHGAIGHSIKLMDNERESGPKRDQ